MNSRRITILCALVVAGVAAPVEAAAGQTRSMFEQFIWPGGGPIGLLLIAVNIATWAIIIEHLVSIRKVNLCPEAVAGEIGSMFAKRQYREAIEFTAAEGSFLSYVVHTALNEASHGYGAMERAIEEAVEERTTRLLRKIEPLNIVGNVAPMVGLMGTVLGMILAFNKIVEAGGVPDAGALADSIGIALVTTFWGLVVAVPALAAYSAVRNRIDGLAAETTMAAGELISRFRPEGEATTGA